MNSQLFFNTRASLNGVTLSIDIDSKSEQVKSLLFQTANKEILKNHSASFEELTKNFTGQNVSWARSFTRSHLENEFTLPSGHRAIAPLGLALINLAIEKYYGESTYLAEERDWLCLCYGVTESDIESYVLNDKNLELKNIIEKTKASSACGSCKVPLIKAIDDIRLKHGLIKGLDHSRSRYDDKGHWIKIANMYPGPLSIKLDDLKNEWMMREEISGVYELVIKGIEGFHVDIEVHGADAKVRVALLSALSDFYKSKLGILFFLHSV